MTSLEDVIGGEIIETERTQVIVEKGGRKFRVFSPYEWLSIREVDEE